MHEHIADSVYVDVRLDAVVQRSTKKRTAALQYIVENRRRQCVTVRLDFSLSRCIQLVLPDGKSVASSVVDVAIGPLQRRHVVHVLRSEGERAYVRVEYSLLSSVAIMKDKGGNDNVSRIERAIAQSSSAFGNMTPPVEHVERWCAGINRWSRERDVRYVDPAFSLTVKSLLGARGPRPTLPLTWMHLDDVVDASWQFVDMKQTDKSVTMWQFVGSDVLDQDSWVCALDVLHADAVYWCQQWFGDTTLQRFAKDRSRIGARSVVSLKLYREGRVSAPIAVDLFVPATVASGDTRGGMICAWPHNGDIYPVLLQKGYAKLRGNYSAIAAVPTRQILHELTGRPIVQLLSSNEVRENTSGAVANVGAVFSPNLQQQNRKGNRHKRSIVIVSFGVFDDHHCAFELIGVVPLSATSSSGFIVRDPTRNFHPIVSAKLGVQLDADEEQGTCVVPDDMFVQLSPAVFELLVDHSSTWRRRRIRPHVDAQRSESFFQVAASCASLQTIVVRGYADYLSGISSRHKVVLTVDRVEDDDKWTRLDLRPRAETDIGSPSTQVSWTASAGEYVISLSLAPTNSSQETPGNSFLIEMNVHENLDLLFRTLDQDMDSVISRTELTDVLFDVERMSPREPAELDAVVDAFFHRYSDGAQGLTKDDLLQLYETVATTSLPTSATLDDRLAKLIWDDLHWILLGSAAEEPTRTIALDDVYELVCAVSSDRDDIAVAVL